MGIRYDAYRLTASTFQRVRDAVVAARRGELDALRALAGDEHDADLEAVRRKRYFLFGPEVIVVLGLEETFAAAVEAVATSAENVDKLPQMLAERLSWELVFGPESAYPPGIECVNVSIGVLPLAARRVLEPRLPEAGLDEADLTQLRALLATFEPDDVLVWIGH